jgi:hypothetical protein
MDLKQQISELRKSTKIALVGSVIVVAGSWGSCQLDLGTQDKTPDAPIVEPAPEASQEKLEDESQAVPEAD